MWGVHLFQNGAYLSSMLDESDLIGDRSPEYLSPTLEVHNLQSGCHYEPSPARELGSNPGLHTSFRFLKAKKRGHDPTYHPDGGLFEVLNIVEGGLRLPQVVELFIPSTTNCDVNSLSAQERRDCIDKIYNVLHCQQVGLKVGALPNGVRGCIRKFGTTTQIMLDRILVETVRGAPPLVLLHATAFLVSIVMHQLSHYIRKKLSETGNLLYSHNGCSAPTKENSITARKELGSLLEEGLWGGSVVFLKP